MYIVMLLLMLLFPMTVQAEQVNYTKIISNWASVQHPDEPFTIKVKVVKPMQTKAGSSNVLAFQTHIRYTTGTEAYIFFIHDGKILSWIDAGVPDEDEDDTEETFIHKDKS